MGIPIHILFKTLLMASVTSLPPLIFVGTEHAYFEKISMIIRRYIHKIGLPALVYSSHRDTTSSIIFASGSMKLVCYRRLLHALALTIDHSVVILFVNYEMPSLKGLSCRLFVLYLDPVQLHLYSIRDRESSNYCHRFP